MDLARKKPATEIGTTRKFSGQMSHVPIP